VDKAAAHVALPVSRQESIRSETNQRLPQFSGGWWRYQWRRLRGALLGREPTAPTAPDGRGSVASSSERESGGLSSGTQYLRERMHTETKAILGAPFLCRFHSPCALPLHTKRAWPCGMHGARILTPPFPLSVACPAVRSQSK
jgi:hypothetical protein